MNEFYKQFLQEWEGISDHVFSREQISKLFEQGRIDKRKAEYLLRLRYEYKADKLRVRDEDDCLVDLEEIRYYLTL